MVPQLLWLAHKKKKQKQTTRPQQTWAASESEGNSICLWVLDRRFPPVMFRLFPLPHLNNPLLFEKQSGKRCPSSPLGRRCVFSASSCLMIFYLVACLDFFFFKCFCGVRKKEGREEKGERKGAGGVKDKRRKGKVSFRLVVDWSACVKEGRGNATLRRSLTSYGMQDLSDASGLFALGRSQFHV